MGVGLSTHSSGAAYKSTCISNQKRVERQAAKTPIRNLKAPPAWITTASILHTKNKTGVIPKDTSKQARIRKSSTHTSPRSVASISATAVEQAAVDVSPAVDPTPDADLPPASAAAICKHLAETTAEAASESVSPAASPASSPHESYCTSAPGSASLVGSAGSISQTAESVKFQLAEVQSPETASVCERTSATKKIRCTACQNAQALAEFYHKCKPAGVTIAQLLPHRDTITANVFLNIYSAPYPDKSSICERVIFTVGYHTAVVVGGVEMAYGPEGLYTLIPGQEEGMTLLRSKDMGAYNPSADAEQRMKALMGQFKDSDYRMCSNNCNRFSGKYLKLITGNGLPRYINAPAYIAKHIPFHSLDEPSPDIAVWPSFTDSLSCTACQALQLAAAPPLEPRTASPHSQSSAQSASRPRDLLADLTDVAAVMLPVQQASVTPTSSSSIISHSSHSFSEPVCYSLSASVPLVWSSLPQTASAADTPADSTSASQPQPSSEAGPVPTAPEQKRASRWKVFVAKVKKVFGKPHSGKVQEASQAQTVS